MKFGIIIGTNEPEKAWNAARLGNTALKQGHEVEIENITHEKYNAKQQIDDFIKNKGIVLACGTCLKSRNQNGSDVCPMSTMIDCVKMVEWADKVITF